MTFGKGPLDRDAKGFDDGNDHRMFVDPAGGMGDGVLPNQRADMWVDSVSTSSPSAGAKPPRISSGIDRPSDSVLSWFRKRNGDSLKGALAFVPWVLQQAFFEGGLDEGIVIHRGTGAVVWSDTSGFTDLTERLAKESNGAELLSQCLMNFFTPLIELINSYRGDVIKFSGDALTIYFQAVDDTMSPKYNCVVPPHGTYGLPDLGPMATSVLRASACCIEIHKRLHMWETGISGVAFCLRIAVGCGNISILQVGGETPPATRVPRHEYLIAGPPLEQISHVESMAKNGETCLSPQAWEYVKDCVIEGRPVEAHPEYHLLLRMDESKYTFPTIKHAAMENDNRMDKQFTLSQLNIIRRYIPSAVYKQIECGTLVYVNEMRNVSVIFINGAGLDVMSSKGAALVQDLVVNVQKACYQHEGTLNKFLIDDKGILFLLVFGLPPLVHTDDPTRSVLACFDMVKIFRRMDLVGKFGVSTGRSYCGVCGSARRMEYSVLGDCVNLAGRLMNSAPPHGIFCDEETMNRSSNELIFHALAPIKVKGRASSIAVFQPVKKDVALEIGLTQERNIRFPWYDHPFAGGSVGLEDMQDSDSLKKNVQRLCGVKTWVGIIKVSEMLGGAFMKDLHKSTMTITNAPATASAPPGSPFHDGGIIVISGDSGMGKVELVEHMVIYAGTKLNALPVFGTMGPRPGDSVRLATELIKTCLSVYRHIDPKSLSPDDFQALQKLAPPELARVLPKLSPALKDSSLREGGTEILDASLEVTMALLPILLKKTAIVLVLQFEYGTSLFPKTLEDQAIFWKVVTRLTELVEREMKQGRSLGHKPLAMVVVSRDAEEGNSAVNFAKERDTYIHLTGLTEENILEYMSSYLNVPEQMVPQVLRQFVTAVTLGNPRHIRETIDQLLESCIQVHVGANKQVKHIECKDIDKINISSWQHTAMVGNTVCLLESLDPLEAAVLKMSTCFTGSFTLPDLAASTCSRWADATHFDFLRLYKAIHQLVESEIIEEIPEAEVTQRRAAGDSTMSMSKKQSQKQAKDSPYGTTQYFQMRNVLIRAVGGAMVLEAQKKSVKRQALIDRALWRELPGRMEELAKKRQAQHIPWYYEQAFRRM